MKPEQASFCPVSETKEIKQSSPTIRSYHPPKGSQSLTQSSCQPHLQIAQALYEKHKVTYPHTDSKALPEDYVSTCHDLLQKSDFQTLLKMLSNKTGSIQAIKGYSITSRLVTTLPSFPPPPVRPNWMQTSQRFTISYSKGSSRFYPPAEWDITTRVTMVSNHSFKTEGKVLVTPSWLSIYGKDQEEKILCPPFPKKANPVSDSELISDETNPHQGIQRQPFFQLRKGQANLSMMKNWLRHLRKKD